MPKRKVEESDNGSRLRTLNSDPITTNTGAEVNGYAIPFVVQVDSMVYLEILSKLQSPNSRLKPQNAHAYPYIGMFAVDADARCCIGMFAVDAGAQCCGVSVFSPAGSMNSTKRLSWLELRTPFLPKI
jgi:hypothetical protein